ncbi:hypothetical protein AB4Y43_01165 [Paraburkholderia sp. BR10872]|uniref:hypothetical protein n=1 Tax=Paraburkholderia sp. BR10872 TaxID=3236989 RepID=UPI0034D2DD5E
MNYPQFPGELLFVCASNAGRIGHSYYYLSNRNAMPLGGLAILSFDLGNLFHCEDFGREIAQAYHPVRAAPESYRDALNALKVFQVPNLVQISDVAERVEKCEAMPRRMIGQKRSPVSERSLGLPDFGDCATAKRIARPADGFDIEWFVVVSMIVFCSGAAAVSTIKQLRVGEDTFPSGGCDRASSEAATTPITGAKVLGLHLAHHPRFNELVARATDWRLYVITTGRAIHRPALDLAILVRLVEESHQVGFAKISTEAYACRIEAFHELRPRYLSRVDEMGLDVPDRGADLLGELLLSLTIQRAVEGLEVGGV